MKWEYGCLFGTSVYGNWAGAQFHGPTEQEQFEGASFVPFLNKLGQDGWELVEVQTHSVGSETQRLYWFKRQVNAGGDASTS